MSVERTLLQSRIVPKIKRYCISKGWQFECVDLRWGVSQEAQKNKKTIEICLNEIRHCRFVSPKPNFIILLGQRYGWIPDASYIPETEYDDIFHLETHSISATELEIYEGLLSQDYLAQNTILYDRILENIPSKESENYIERDAVGQIKRLKDKVRDFISKNNIIEEKISFDTYTSQEYKDKFVNQMTSMIKSLVDKEIEENICMDDYMIEDIFQSDIQASCTNSRYSDIIARVELSKSRIVVIRSTDEVQRLAVLSEYASIHSESSYFRTLGRSWMSSEGMGFLRAFLVRHEIKFHLSDTFKRNIERIRDLLKYPNSYNINYPQHIIIDSLDSLSLKDPLLYFTWFAPSISNSKILLSLSDTRYLKHLHVSDYDIIDIKPETHFQYSNFVSTIERISRPENNSPAFVSLAIGLICWSHSGVTEDEILEMAAMNESYYKELTLNSIHKLPVVENARPRIPYSIWSILYYSIKSMLVVRNSFGATTFVFGNDNYKKFATEYYGVKNRESSYELIIRYFNIPDMYKTHRALDELPNAYIAIESYESLYKLIEDSSFCQRLVEQGLGERLVEYVRILKWNLGKDKKKAEYLNGMSDFLKREMDALCKYAKFDKSFFKRKLEMYISKANDSFSQMYRQEAIFLRQCTSASRIQGGQALIVTYEKNGESLCEIVDIETETIIAMRYIDVDVIEKGENIYPGRLDKSYIDGDIVYIYDIHGFINEWNYISNEFNKIETGHLDRIPQDKSPEFTIPEDFDLGSEEHIISSGKVDADSFYVVTCQSLRLITKKE